MHFIKVISDASGISEIAIQDYLKNVEQELKHEKEEIKVAGEAIAKMHRKDSIERKLLGIALWQKSLKAPTMDFEMIFNKLGEVSKKYEDSTQDLLFEAEIFYNDNENLEKSVKEMFLNLEEENINELLAKKIQELGREPDGERGKQILQEINELTKKKEEIKNNRVKK